MIEENMFRSKDLAVSLNGLATSLLYFSSVICFIFITIIFINLLSPKLIIINLPSYKPNAKTSLGGIEKMLFRVQEKNGTFPAMQNSID